MKLRDAGLGSVRGVVIGRETGGQGWVRFDKPKVKTVTLERSTLRDAAEVEAWVERQKTKLFEAVRQGPVLVS